MAEGRMQIVIITGLSGAGRRTAAHTVEDLGWYLVDNLPAALLPELAHYLAERGITRLAVVLDVRARSDLEELPAVVALLSPLTEPPTIVYLEADDAVIVRRQESNRRPLPLQGTGTLLDGVRAERRMLSTLRAAADIVIDTTALTIHQLQARLIAAFAGEAGRCLTVTVISFGFKRGLPLDADLVLDVRFLPNPHWVPELRSQSGLAPAVAAYVLDSPVAQHYLDQSSQLFATIAEGYITEGKRQVALAVGCTGGKHRSVAMSEALAQAIRAQGHAVTTLHRDLGRE